MSDPSLVPTSITACVIARDAAQHLPEVLPGLRWADEVLVVLDDATRDASAAVAAPWADRVEQATFISFPAQRNRALELAASTWVVFIDADERVSAELAQEVRDQVLQSEQARAGGAGDAPVGFWVPRHNVVFGRLVRGGGWSPDYQLRVLRRPQARFDERRLVHELVRLDGPAEYLTERLLHLNYESVRQFVAKQRRYTALEAESLRADGVTYRRRALLGQPLRELTRRYVELGGWVDGPVGLFLSLAMAYYAFERVRLVRQAAVDPYAARGR